MKLVNRLLRQFAMAFNTLLSVTFHVVAPSLDVFGIFSSVLTSVLVLFSFENNFFFVHDNSVIDLCCPLGTSKIYLISE